MEQLTQGQLDASETREAKSTLNRLRRRNGADSQ